jgi:hypothetical protein
LAFALSLDRCDADRDPVWLSFGMIAAASLPSAIEIEIKPREVASRSIKQGDALNAFSIQITHRDDSAERTRRGRSADVSIRRHLRPVLPRVPGIRAREQVGTNKWRVQE